LENQQSEQCPILVVRDSPFLIVVGDVLIAARPTASLFHAFFTKIRSPLRVGTRCNSPDRGFRTRTPHLPVTPFPPSHHVLHGPSENRCITHPQQPVEDAEPLRKARPRKAPPHEI